MTTIAIPSPTNDPSDWLRWQRLARVQELCRQHLREPTVADDGTTLSVTFTPDLTAGELATLRRIVRISGISVVTPDELAAVEPSLDGLIAYMAVATPTLAQTAAATKAIIRVLGVLLRD